MSDRQQVLLGILLAFLSGSVMIGGSLLSLVESDFMGQKAATATYIAAWVMPAFITPTPQPGQPTFTAAPRSAMLLTPTPTFGAPAGCEPPAGWLSIMLPLGGSLAETASAYGISAADLAIANCIPAETSNLPPGSFLFVPSPTATPTLFPSATFTMTPTIYVCGAPPGWVQVLIRRGDTLVSLSALTGVSVEELQKANCMGNSVEISPGDYLFLPFYPYPTLWPSRTPWPTRTATRNVPTPTVVQYPTFTPIQIPPSATNIPQPTAVPTVPVSTQPFPTVIFETQVPTVYPSNTAPPPPTQPPPPTATDAPLPTIIPEPVDPSPTPRETAT